MSVDDARAAADAGVKAAAAKLGSAAAVIVIVRELDGGLAVGTNIIGDRPAQLRIITEAAGIVRNDGVII